MLAVDTYGTLAEADRAMTDRSRYLGGGTLLMRSINHGNLGFDRVVRSTDPTLGRIQPDGDLVTIGAGATMTAILASQELAFLAPVARSVGGPAIRNMASVGGNLFAPPPYGDLATALLALDARVRFANGTESGIESLLADRESVPGLVDAVALPRPGDGEFRFSKVTRVRPKGVAVLSIAACLPTAMGRVSGARVAFGSMGPSPVRARSVEAALEGAALDERGISRALEAVRGDISPSDDALASAWYRSEIAPVHLRRLLLERTE